VGDGARSGAVLRRERVFLLALLCVLLLSGAPAVERELPDVAASPWAELTLGDVGGVVDRSLADANPSLSEEERTRIAAAVLRYSAQYDLDPELVTAVMLVESAARPWARSPKGAVGLMQVMPHMMLPMGLAGNMTTIESNIEAGCFILAHNIERLGEENGISAYFWGSHIRGVAYLEKVLQARERVRGLRTS
jgi:hypothetical protein